MLAENNSAKKLDRIDRKILVELQKDGRLSNVELAKRVGLSPTPCLERVRKLERRGVIRGYGAIIDTTGDFDSINARDTFMIARLGESGAGAAGGAGRAVTRPGGTVDDGAAGRGAGGGDIGKAVAGLRHDLLFPPPAFTQHRCMKHWPLF